jgi:hypothetical protein
VSFERDKDKSVLFFTQSAQRAQNSYPLFYSTLALEGRKLRYNGSVGVKYTPVLTLIFFSHTESTEYTDFPSGDIFLV